MGASALEVLGELAALIDRAAGRPVPSMYRYVLKHGEVFTPAPLSPGFSRGPAGNCYLNAARLVITVPELRYVEGYGVTPYFPLPLEHGWAVTADGRVVDPTWEKPEECSYVGVVIPLEQLIERGRAGVLEELAREAGADVPPGWSDR